MAQNPLQSTYRGGENRVTSSMLAVFERIDLGLVKALLAAAAGEAPLEVVQFVNQPPGPATPAHEPQRVHTVQTCAPSARDSSA